MEDKYDRRIDMAIPATPNDRRKKKKLRNVITVPGTYWNNFDIDENDYRVLVSINQMHQEEDREFDIENRIKIKEDDEDRRVRMLRWDYYYDRWYHGGRPTMRLSKHIIELDALEKLYLDQTYELPRWIGELRNLKELHFYTRYRGSSYETPVHSLPDKIGNLTSLEVLKLTGECFELLPSSIGNLTNLKELVLGPNKKLHNIPDEIGNLTSLESLFLNDTGIVSLPGSIGRLTNLKELDLGFTENLHDLPKEIGKLTNLKVLIFIFSRIASLPTSVGNLMNLKELNLRATINLDNLPDEIGNLINLESLILQSSKISSLPNSIGNLMNLKELDLEGAFGRGYFQALPDEIGGLINLKSIFLRCNRKFHSIPNTIGSLVNLEFLDLSWSDIASLPSSIGNLVNLKGLDLVGVRRLKSLPDEIKNLTRLETLGIRWTSINTIPSATIRNMKNLQVLHLDYSFLGGDHQEVLVELLEQHPRLECIGGDEDDAPLKSNVDVHYALIRNRIRSRFLFPQNSQELSLPPLSLWPLFFEKVKLATTLLMPRKYWRNPRSVSHEYCGSCERFYEGVFSETDGIFQLLVDHGGTILSRATDASSTSVSTSTK
jgi:Leucine-rich repeat (LRR) protein